MKRARGFSLVELVVAITIIGIASATLVGLMGSLSSRSGEALVAAQSTQIASAYFDEVFGQPFAAIGGYNGLHHVGARDRNGNAIAGLGSYVVDVTVANVNWGAPAVPARLITVTVTDPANRITVLSGYRTNHP